MPVINKVKKDLRKHTNKQKAKVFPKFFKTGPGEYGEGDRFIGVTVPNCRLVANKYSKITLLDAQNLLKSKFHEERLVALLILVHKFAKADKYGKKKIFHLYLKNTEYINNWDLVDLSCHKIIGEYLTDKPKDRLIKLAKSTNLWERRVAIVSTYAFIRKSKYAPTLKISKILLNDKHDLIHKAIGWMLREVGKKNEKALEEFLQKNYNKMPRTTLRYAIERFPEKKRQLYLKSKPAKSQLSLT
jgi:3-methyladenine DNA glycosylase AlkD